MYFYSDYGNSNLSNDAQKHYNQAHIQTSYSLLYPALLSTQRIAPCKLHSILNLWLFASQPECIIPLVNLMQKHQSINADNMYRNYALSGWISIIVNSLLRLLTGLDKTVGKMEVWIWSLGWTIISAESQFPYYPLNRLYSMQYLE